jgi:hypothetical protein
MTNRLERLICNGKTEKAILLIERRLRGDSLDSQIQSEDHISEYVRDAVKSLSNSDICSYLDRVLIRLLPNDIRKFGRFSKNPESTCLALKVIGELYLEFRLTPGLDCFKLIEGSVNTLVFFSKINNPIYLSGYATSLAVVLGLFSGHPSITITITPSVLRLASSTMAENALLGLSLACPEWVYERLHIWLECVDNHNSWLPRIVEECRYRINNIKKDFDPIHRATSCVLEQRGWTELERKLRTATKTSFVFNANPIAIRTRKPSAQQRNSPAGDTFQINALPFAEQIVMSAFAEYVKSAHQIIFENVNWNESDEQRNSRVAVPLTSGTANNWNMRFSDYPIFTTRANLRELVRSGSKFRDFWIGVMRQKDEGLITQDANFWKERIPKNFSGGGLAGADFDRLREDVFCELGSPIDAEMDHFQVFRGLTQCPDNQIIVVSGLQEKVLALDYSARFVCLGYIKSTSYVKFENTMLTKEWKVFAHDFSIDESAIHSINPDTYQLPNTLEYKKIIASAYEIHSAINKNL